MNRIALFWLPAASRTTVAVTALGLLTTEPMDPKRLNPAGTREHPSQRAHRRVPIFNAHGMEGNTSTPTSRRSAKPTQFLPLPPIRGTGPSKAPGRSTSAGGRSSTCIEGRYSFSFGPAPVFH